MHVICMFDHSIPIHNTRDVNQGFTNNQALIIILMQDTTSSMQASNLAAECF